MEHLHPLSDFFWLTDSVSQNFQPTPHLLTSSEMAVIGGSIFGVSVAYRLSQLDAEAVLLEQ
jgi:hypothetical protein